MKKKRYIFICIFLLLAVIFVIPLVVRPKEIEVDNTDISVTSYTETYNIIKDSDNQNYMDVYVTVEGEYIKPTQPLKYYISKYQYTTLTHSKLDSLDVSGYDGDILDISDKGDYYELTLGSTEESSDNDQWVSGDFDYIFNYRLKPMKGTLFTNIELINYHIMKRCDNYSTYNNSEYTFKLKTNKDKTVSQSIDIQGNDSIELTKDLIEKSNVRLFLQFEGLPDERALSDIFLPTKYTILVVFTFLIIWLFISSAFKIYPKKTGQPFDLGTMLHKKKTYTVRDVMAVILSLEHKHLIEICDKEVPQWLNTNTQSVNFTIKIVDDQTESTKPARPTKLSKLSIFEQYFMNLLNDNDGILESKKLHYDEYVEDFYILAKSTRKHSIPNLNTIVYYLVGILMVCLIFSFDELKIIYALPMMIAVTMRFFKINLSFKYEDLSIALLLILSLIWKDVGYFLFPWSWYVMGNKMAAAGTELNPGNIKDRLTAIICAFLCNDDKFIDQLDIEKGEDFYLYLYYS